MSTSGSIARKLALDTQTPRTPTQKKKRNVVDSSDESSPVHEKIAAQPRKNGSPRGMQRPGTADDEVDESDEELEEEVETTPAKAAQKDRRVESTPKAAKGAKGAARAMGGKKRDKHAAEQEAPGDDEVDELASSKRIRTAAGRDGSSLQQNSSASLGVPADRPTSSVSSPVSIIRTGNAAASEDDEDVDGGPAMSVDAGKHGDTTMEEDTIMVETHRGTDSFAGKDDRIIAQQNRTLDVLDGIVAQPAVANGKGPRGKKRDAAAAKEQESQHDSPRHARSESENRSPSQESQAVRRPTTAHRGRQPSGPRNNSSPHGMGVGLSRPSAEPSRTRQTRPTLIDPSTVSTDSQCVNVAVVSRDDGRVRPALDGRLTSAEEEHEPVVPATATPKNASGTTGNLPLGTSPHRRLTRTNAAKNGQTAASSKATEGKELAETLVVPGSTEEADDALEQTLPAAPAAQQPKANRNQVTESGGPGPALFPKSPQRVPKKTYANNRGRVLPAEPDSPSKRPVVDADGANEDAGNNANDGDADGDESPTEDEDEAEPTAATNARGRPALKPEPDSAATKFTAARKAPAKPGRGLVKGRQRASSDSDATDDEANADDDDAGLESEEEDRVVAKKAKPAAAKRQQATKPSKQVAGPVTSATKHDSKQSRESKKRANKGKTEPASDSEEDPAPPPKRSRTKTSEPAPSIASGRQGKAPAAKADASSPVRRAKPFADHAFLLSKGTDTQKAQLTVKIKSLGGVVVDQFSQIYSPSTTTSPPTVSLQKGYASLKALYVLVLPSKNGIERPADDPGCTPKQLMAIALGCPVVSFKYVDDLAAGTDVHWTRYLLATGRSKHAQAVLSQVVTGAWVTGEGLPSEPGPGDGHLKLMDGLSVTCICAAKDDPLYPEILSMLGADVTIVKSMTAAKKIQDHDYLFVENAAVVGSDQVAGEVVTTEWLKECLINKRLMPAEQTQASDEGPKRKRARRTES